MSEIPEQSKPILEVAPLAEEVTPVTYVPMMESLREAAAMEKADTRIIEELSKSIDLLDDCVRSSQAAKYRKHAVEAQIITRRVQAIRDLSKILEGIRDRINTNQEVKTIAMVLRLSREVMREAGLSSENREIVIQNLAMKIDEETTKRRQLEKRARS
jgi:flagellar biosynthesis component FlhA